MPKKLKKRDPALSSEKMARIAQVAHEANRAYCKTIGDNSHKSWSQTSAELKASAISGVEAIDRGDVRRPQDSHANWMKFKLENGWKYGPGKDEAKKEHHCLVPFNQLPEDERVKDFLFYNIVVTLLQHKYMRDLEE